MWACCSPLRDRSRGKSMSTGLALDAGEPHEVQQIQVQGLAPESRQPSLPVQAGGGKDRALPCQKKTREYWWMGNWTWDSNVPSQPRKPNVSWVASKETCQQVEGGRWSCPSTLCWWGLTSGVLHPDSSPQYRTDIDQLDHIQLRAIEMIQGMEHLSYDDRLRDLGLLSLEKRRLWGDLIAAFQYLKGSYRKEGDRLFSRVCGDRTSGKVFKLKEGRFRLPIRKKSFTVRLVAQRCGLMPCPWRLSRQGWIRPWATCSSCACLCSLQERWTRWSLKAPSKSLDTMVLFSNSFIKTRSTAVYSLLFRTLCLARVSKCTIAITGISTAQHCFPMPCFQLMQC